MSKILGFAFASKGLISHSGVCLQITAAAKEKNLKLYRQIEDNEKELLTEFNTPLLTKGLYNFNIHSKFRNIYTLRDKIKDSINKESDHNYNSFEDINENTRERGRILELWHQYFNSNEIIFDEYKAYTFVETPKKFWVYDMVPASKEFSNVDETSLLPLPGTSVTYSLFSERLKKEIFSKDFIIPEILPGSFELNDVFQEDPYLYHIGLSLNNECLWGIFSDRPPKNKPHLAKAIKINHNSLICRIKPDILNLRNGKNGKETFYYNDLAPKIPYSEIMNSSLRVSKIKIDTNNPNNFNAISFHTKFFKAENFPKTFSIIYPYK